MQADSTSRLAKTKGTGLGLHICKLNVGVLNGVFCLASSIHRGSTFFVAIPVSFTNNNGITFLTHSNSVDSVTDLIARPGEYHSFTDEDDDSSHLPSSHSSLHDDELLYLEPGDSSTKVLLIVDDSKVNLKLAERKIKLEFPDSFKIILIETGLQCIQRIRDMVEANQYHEVAGVLCDYHMPEMDGAETIRNIRAIEATLDYKKRVPIVAFTADITSDSHKELRVAGADYTLSKPSPDNALETLCRKFLKEK